MFALPIYKKKKKKAFLVHICLLGQCHCFCLAAPLKTEAQIHLFCLYMDFGAGALGIILVLHLPLGLASRALPSSAPGPRLSRGVHFLSLSFSKCHNVPRVMEYVFN